MLLKICRRFVSSGLLFLAAALAGCSLFSSDAWQGPSPLSGRPPKPLKESHEIQGGFTVLVGAPGQPAVARVISDIGAFAQQHGFMRQSARAPWQLDPASHQPLPPTTERYVLEKIVLDVTYQASDFRVVAHLHSFSPRLSHAFADRFYQDFNRDHAGHYGEENPIFENDYLNEYSGLYGGT